MATVYALMVGIERYRDSRLSRLQGCRADIADARAALTARLRGAVDLLVRELYDEDATRDVEQPLDGAPRGVFSWALSRALRRSPCEWDAMAGRSIPVPPTAAKRGRV